MAQSQTRKKKILEEVQRNRRRQRTVTLTILAIVFITLLVGGIWALTRPKSGLPDYLGCVNGALSYHSHPHLSIILDGVTQTIPANIGLEGGCIHPIHTHNTDGVLHVEPDQNRDFTLGDFFLVWGQPFNSTSILSRHGGSVTLTVNNTPEPLLTYTLPRDAQTAQQTCYGSNDQQVPCKTYYLVITFSSTQQASS